MFRITLIWKWENKKRSWQALSNWKSLSQPSSNPKFILIWKKRAWKWKGKYKINKSRIINWIWIKELIKWITYTEI